MDIFVPAVKAASTGSAPVEPIGKNPDVATPKEETALEAPPKRIP